MNTKPNPFIPLINALEETHLAGTIPSLQDPNLSNFLDAYNILQQCTLTHHLQCLLAPDPDRIHDPSQGKAPSATFVAGAYLRTLNLMERSKSRADRIAARYNRKPTAAEAFRLNTATQFLLTELSGGEKPAREIIKTARSVAISQRTLERAKAELGVMSIQRVPAGKSSESRLWYWALPVTPNKTVDSASETPDRQAAMAV